HAYARAAGGLARLRAADRPRAARGGRVAGGRAAARLRLRADGLRRGRGRAARRARQRPCPDPDRAVRADMIPLDGNALGGELYDVFGEDMTAAVATCAGCGAVFRVAEVAVYLGGPGAVARCRRCDTVLVALVTVRGTT